MVLLQEWAVLSVIRCVVTAVLLFLKHVLHRFVCEFDQYLILLRVVEVEKLEQGEHTDHRQ